MKSILFSVISSLFCLTIYSQSPNIEWQKSFGGTLFEEAFCIKQTEDDGYILVGYTNSDNGTVVTGNLGWYDVWVAKLDATGNLEWQKTYGGLKHDWGYSIEPTLDGGYIIAGSTASNDGDVTENKGDYDYWIFKIDATGTLIWQKTYGGSDYEYARSVKQTPDGGYIVAGFTSSTDGDVIGNHSAVSDYWILKLDADGTLLWQKTLGGINHDAAYDIQLTSDGGFIIAGPAASYNGDITGSHGSWDFWVVKLNATGTLVWQKALGGNSEDFAHSIQQTSDDGFIVTGYTFSNNGDITENNGDYDYWIVKLNAVGELSWQKSFGGSGSDWAYSVIQTNDEGYIIAGHSESTDGDVVGNHGGNDMWLVRLNSVGDFLWQKTLGGSGDDRAFSIKQTSDDGFIVAGVSWSTDGDLSSNEGYGDVWIVKLEPESLAVADFDSSSYFIYPNPTNQLITIQSSAGSDELFTYKIVDTLGRMIMKGNSLFSEEINIENLSNGNYIIEVETKNGQRRSEKLIKN